MKSIILGLLLSIPLFISAQNITNLHDDKGFYCDYTIVDGDTVFMMYLDEVYIWGNKSFRNSAESRQWNRLVKNVKTVYPYAKLAGIKFNEYSHEIAGITSEKRKKELMTKAEDELQAQFGNELKELTFSQGKILIKLIDRQTSNSSYEIVKDFRGRFRAFFYQSFARLFGYNLKVRYDPLGDDADIERIVLMIESGAI